MRFQSLHRRGRVAVAVAGLLAAGPFAVAQAPSAPRPQFKGIWEPVSYTEDLELLDVFFVNARVGWASGDGGTIIHTRDGGETWTAQLGGDPASSEARIRRLRFLDEYRGWAVQDRRLLRTVDGENWEAIGTVPAFMRDFAFVSARQGVASGTEAAVGISSDVFLTRDGGRTWKVVARCALRVMLDGLNRTLGCGIDRFHFPTPEVGYLVGHVPCVGMGCGGPPVLGKTEDGGETWRFLLGPGNVPTSRLLDLFFTDAATGFVAVSVDGERKIFMTTDGGATWKGLVGSPGRWLAFADPEVGWGVDEHALNFTTNGGARWNSRPHRFPAVPRAVSFPRRDRGYVVGEHGMVLRYRVVPAAEVTRPEVIVTAAMPGVSSPLDDEADQVRTILAELETAVSRLPDSGPASPDPAAAAAGDPAPKPGSEPAPEPPPPPTAEAVIAQPAAPFVGTCCGAPVNRLGLIVGAIARSLPSFLQRYRNTNLLVAGLRMINDLPGRFGDLRSAIQAFKSAGDKASAQDALTQIGAAAQSLHQTTKAAFQEELPPYEPVGDLDVPGTDAAAGALRAATGADSVAPAVGKAAADKARKGIGGLIKKRIRIPE